MPWCDDCSKFWNAPELAGRGACPTCGRVLAVPGPGGVAVPPAVVARDELAPGGTAFRDAAVPSIAVAPEARVSGRAAMAPTAVGAEAPAPSGATATPSALAAVAPVPPAPSSSSRVKGAPWHFKLMVLGVTVYMIYRIYWLIEWLPKHI